MIKEKGQNKKLLKKIERKDEKRERKKGQRRNIKEKNWNIKSEKAMKIIEET